MHDLCSILLQIRSKIENESLQEYEQTSPGGDHITALNEVHSDARRMTGEELSIMIEGRYGKGRVETDLHSLISAS